MKRVKIRNKTYSTPESAWNFVSENPKQIVDDLISSGACGKPERWVPETETYDSNDVLEERVLDIDGTPVRQVKLKAEYVIEIEDITKEYALSQCFAKRLAEYPTPEDFLNAYFDGGLEALAAKRAAIKKKYPKP